MATYHEPEVASVVGFPVPLMNPTLVTQTIPYPEFESRKEIPGYTFAFSLMFLPYDRSWILTLKREYQSYLLTSSEYEQEYFVFRTSLVVDGSDVFSMGAGYSLESASDASCHSLVRQIKRIKGIFIMPRNIIGYPNLRGQCYLISAFLPLLFCPPFISCLFNSMFEFKRLCHLGVHKENLKLRREPEDPFYWTSSLFKIYKDFYQVSNKGRLQLLNIQYFSKYRLHDKEYEKMQNVPETYQLPTDDLRLDRSLIKGLCSVLSTYCSRRYATPGGDERSSYVHIIRKIASENPIFIEKFFTKLSFKFTCSGCTGGPFRGNLQLPLLAASPVIDFESLLNNGHALCHEQHLQYPHTTNGLNCMEPARCILEGEIISLSEVLCFGVKNEESEKFKPIPEFITYSAGGKKRKFFHLVSSVVITCYKSKKGIDYQDFYHPYEEGDIDMGAHTFLHFRAIPDYVEVNNGFIYKVDDRIFRKPTPCSFHMYLDEKYVSYVPQVDMSSLAKNPFYPV